MVRIARCLDLRVDLLESGMLFRLKVVPGSNRGCYANGIGPKGHRLLLNVTTSAPTMSRD